MIWKTAAELDLTESYLYIRQDSPAAAERLLDAVEHALAMLLQNPHAGHSWKFRSPRARGLRSWTPKEFPQYLIFYRFFEGDLEVVRILHGHRDLLQISFDDPS